MVIVDLNHGECTTSVDYQLLKTKLHFEDYKSLLCSNSSNTLQVIEVRRKELEDDEWKITLLDLMTQQVICEH